MSRQSEEYAAAWEALKASRGFGALSGAEDQWQAAGQMIKDHYNDKELREKALTLAVQAMPHLTPGVDLIDVAAKFANYLRGDAA